MESLFVILVNKSLVVEFGFRKLTCVVCHIQHAYENFGGIFV